MAKDDAKLNTHVYILSLMESAGQENEHWCSDGRTWAWDTWLANIMMHLWVDTEKQPSWSVKHTCLFYEETPSDGPIPHIQNDTMAKDAW